MPERARRRWLPALNRTIWILAAGRLLSQVGTGFTLFYAPIFFVNQVGLSATRVGAALGSGQISGIAGRFWGGSLSDAARWGRRRTLLLSAAVSALADVALALTDGFGLLLLGNLLMGLGVGLYWPATEAVVADLTAPAERNEAFAITRLADSLGLGVGVVLGGGLIASAGAYRALFAIDGLSFLAFFAVIYWAVPETRRPQAAGGDNRWGQNWLAALRDRALMVYAAANVLFTTYIAQIQSTLPLYLRNYVAGAEGEAGLSATTLGGAFTWHIAFAALVQLPVARALNRVSRVRALLASLLLWALGFGLVWAAGQLAAGALVAVVLALAVLALGIVTYTPSASALVADIAPEARRGVYLSVNSQCWAIGYLIGPPLGGWALDRARYVTDGFWLVAAASTLAGMLILRALARLLWRRPVTE